jgi:hypothetical protein
VAGSGLASSSWNVKVKVKVKVKSTASTGSWQAFRRDSTPQKKPWRKPRPEDHGMDLKSQR